MLSAASAVWPIHPRHQRLAVLTDVLLDLDREHFDRIHVFVQEFDHPPELPVDLVGDEEQTQAAGGEVGLDLAPVDLLVDSAAEGLGQGLLDRRVGLLASRGQGVADVVHRPMDGGMGGVVEELADDFAADAGVAGALDLDQGRDAVLIEEEVVNGPAVVAALAVGDAELALDEEPPAGVGVVDLIAGEEVGVLGEEALEEVFGVVGLLVHRAEVAEPPAGIGVVDLVAGEEVGMVGEEALEEFFGVVGLLVHRAEVAAVEQEDAAVHVACRRAPINEALPPAD